MLPLIVCLPVLAISISFDLILQTWVLTSADLAAQFKRSQPELDYESLVRQHHLTYAIGVFSVACYVTAFIGIIGVRQRWRHTQPSPPREATGR